MLAGGLLSVLTVQRCLELRKSRAHVRRLLALGGREHAPGHYGVMVVIHATWFGAIALEAWATPRVSEVMLGLGGICLVSGQWLRYQAMRALGERWTVRIVTLPGEPPVTRGIFRYLRHPNYLGVALEIAGVPLVVSAWRTAIVFSIANLILLRIRIREEEAALCLDNAYHRYRAGPPGAWVYGLHQQQIAEVQEET